MNQTKIAAIALMLLATIGAGSAELCSDQFGGYCPTEEGRDCVNVNNYPACCNTRNCTSRYGGNWAPECPSGGDSCDEDKGEVCAVVIDGRVNQRLKCIPKEALLCNQYIELEANAQCGPRGYPLGYGLKYCSRFFQHASNFSARGQEFIKCTAKCLLQQANSYMNNLRNRRQIDCDALKTAAYNAHPDCYVQCNFCTTIAPNVHAFTRVLDWIDLDSDQVAETLLKCTLSGAQITGRAVEKGIGKILGGLNLL